MDFNFSSEDLMLRDMLRRFVQKEAQPLEMKYFNNGELDPDERTRLRQAVEQLGLWGALAPEEFGGGLELVTTCLIEEELGKTFIPVELGDVSPLLYACTGEQVPRFLEPAMNGDRRGIIAAREPGKLLPETWASTANPGVDGFVLSGIKYLRSLPIPEDFFIFFAHSPEGLTAFLLDANNPGLELSKNGEITLVANDCLVKEDAILGEAGRVLALESDAGPRAWVREGAHYLGIVERLITMAVEHAKDWVSLGAPLSSRPAVWRMVAEMRVELECARWMVYHAAWLADEGKPIRSAAAQVRLATGEMLQRAVDRTDMIFTGPGPQRIIQSKISSQMLELALEHARAAVAAEIMNA